MKPAEAKNYKKFKTRSYCVGGRHYSGTKDIKLGKTSNGIPILKGICVKCDRNKTMIT